MFVIDSQNQSWRRDSLAQLALASRGVPILVIPRAFKFSFRSPHAQLLQFGLCFGSTVLFLQSTKLCADLGVVYRGEPTLYHLQTDVFPEEPTAHPHRPDDPFVLIPPVDVGPHITTEYVGLEELQRFGAERLGLSSEMGCFWGVDSGDADGDLTCFES